MAFNLNNWFNNVVDDVDEFIEGVGDGLDAAVDAVGDAIGNAAQGAGAAISDAVEDVSNAISESGAVGNWFIRGVEGFVETTAGHVESSADFLVALGLTIGEGDSGHLAEWWEEHDGVLLYDPIEWGTSGVVDIDHEGGGNWNVGLDIGFAETEFDIGLGGGRDSEVAAQPETESEAEPDAERPGRDATWTGVPRPDPAKPDGAKPDGATPHESEPDDMKPEETRPQDTKPETTPDDTRTETDDSVDLPADEQPVADDTNDDLPDLELPPVLDLLAPPDTTDDVIVGDESPVPQAEADDESMSGEAELELPALGEPATEPPIEQPVTAEVPAPEVAADEGAETAAPPADDPVDEASEVDVPMPEVEVDLPEPAEPESDFQQAIAAAEEAAEAASSIWDDLGD